MAYNKETGMYEGWIYMITNKYNGKQYIGQTIQTIQKRWIQHCCPGDKEYITALDKAIQKYGKEHFIVMYLDRAGSKSREDVIDQLDILERKYIKMFNTLAPNGYNIDAGGHSGNFNGVRVNVYNINGEFIKQYPSKISASEDIGINVRTINAICGGETPNYKRCLVFRNDGDSFDKYDVCSYYMKPTYQFDLNGNLVGQYSSRQEAAEQSGCNFIGDIIDNPHRIGKGFWWSSVPEFNYQGVEKKPIYPVDLYTVDGEYIRTYPSVSACAIDIKSASSTVSRVCKRKGYSTKGYVVRYSGDPF